MPGLHDAHSHLMLGAFQKLHEASLGWFSGEKETIAKLKQHCSRDACDVSGAWLIGNFYVQANFPDGKPDRKFLDAEFPDTPVMIREHSCHHVFLNTKGLEVAGYTSEDYQKKLHGGWFVRNKDGEITGECVEAAAGKAYLAVPKSKPEVYEHALEFACKMANRFGITSVQVLSQITDLMMGSIIKPSGITSSSDIGKERQTDNRRQCSHCLRTSQFRHGKTREST